MFDQVMTTTLWLYHSLGVTRYGRQYHPGVEIKAYVERRSGVHSQGQGVDSTYQNHVYSHTPIELNDKISWQAPADSPVDHEADVNVARAVVMLRVSPALDGSETLYQASVG